MVPKIDIRDISWWFWFVTLIFIVVALTGWLSGYYAVMVVSAIQIAYFVSRDHSLVTFPVQIRIVYFAFTLLGLSTTVRFPFYILLLIGTIMVTFLGRCSIALMLKHMPWNRERELRLS